MCYQAEIASWLPRDFRFQMSKAGIIAQSVQLKAVDATRVTCRAASECPERSCLMARETQLESRSCGK